MSTPRKSDLEQVLEFLVNEDTDKAESLLHEYIVAKSRSIYESVVNEEDDECNDMDDEVENEEEVKEDIGGDEKEDFVADIEADSDNIDADEVNDGEVEDDSEGEVEDEDRIDDLESQLEELRAEFETLMKQEMEEPYHDEGEFAGEYSADGEGEADMSMDMDFGMDDERVTEATKLQDEVSVSMDKEGEYAGTGAKSEKAKINTTSSYSHAASKEESRAVDFTKGSGEKGGSAEKPKDHTPSDNIDEEPSNVNGTFDEDESGYVGTGSKSKKGKVQSKSPLSKTPAE